MTEPVRRNDNAALPSRAQLPKLMFEAARGVPATCLGVALACSIDMAAGNIVSAPLYIPVVVYLAWTRGFAGALMASLACTAARGLLDHGGRDGTLLGVSMVAPGWSALVRFSIYAAVGATVARLRQLVRQRDRLVGELLAALDEVRTLRGLLPMCAWCKQIRDDESGGTWLPIETYLTRKTATKVSHGICPRCAKKTFAGAGDQEADRS